MYKCTKTLQFLLKNFLRCLKVEKNDMNLNKNDMLMPEEKNASNFSYDRKKKSENKD